VTTGFEESDAMATKQERARRKLEATAHHEAGHVAASLRNGRGFLYVTIVETEDACGYVMKTKPPAWLRPDVDRMTARGERWLENEILIGLVGMEAERKFTGRRNHLGASSDYRHAADLAEYLYPLGEPVYDKFMAFMVERARAFVASPIVWEEIQAIAEALLARSKLTCKEVKQILRDRLMAKVEKRADPIPRPPESEGPRGGGPTASD